MWQRKEHDTGISRYAGGVGIGKNQGTLLVMSEPREHLIEPFADKLPRGDRDEFGKRMD